MSLNIFFRLIPENYRKFACIAGGAAVDLSKASDVDIFLFHGGHSPGKNGFNKVMQEMHGDKIKFAESLHEDKPRHIQPIVDGFLSECFTEGYSSETGLLATIETGLLPVQILLTNYYDIASLLGNFDISTHAVAYDHLGTRYTAAGFTTEVWEPPVLGTVRDPNRTLERYRKILLRYGMIADIDAVLKLLTMPEPAQNDKNRFTIISGVGEGLTFNV